jgi:hypothetical protein
MTSSPDPGNRRTRVAIFTTDDIVWGLSTWKKAVPLLAEDREVDVVGIYLFPDRLIQMTGGKIMFWYLRTFGLRAFLLLGLFSLKRRVHTLRPPISSWRDLANAYGLQLLRGDSPNADEVVRWAKKNSIDIIVIMVGDILKQEIIGTAIKGVINKHAAMLPSCRGLFPFFWSRLENVPTGVTFHKVEPEIDTGQILVQKAHPGGKTDISMLRFYIDVYAMYPELLVEAIHRMIDGKTMDPRQDLRSSYHSLPTREAYLEFRNAGHWICKVSDLFYEPGQTRTAS